MNALQQVVAEQGIFRDAVLQAALEAVDLVGSLTDIAAFSEEVLVDIRYSPGVKVKASIPRKDPGEVRGAAAERIDIGARLENGISRNDFFAAFTRT